MSKFGNRIIACLLLPAMLALGACGFFSGGNEPETEIETDENANRPELVLSYAELGQYKVIYPDSTDRATISAADRLVTSIGSACGITLTSDTDYIGKTKTVPTGTKEILVGATNRPESVGVRYLDYLVTNENERIVISGGNGEKTAEAVNWFLENCIGEGKVTVPGWHRNGAEYPNENTTVGGIPLKNFSFPMVAGSADDTLREYLGKKYGIVSKSSDGYEIHLVADQSVNATEYAVRLNDKILEIVGSSILSNMEIVVTNFISKLETEGTKVIPLLNAEVMVISEQLRSVTQADVDALRAKSDQMISEIQNTPNIAIPSGAKVYYVSPTGNDSNNGTSQATPWKTIDKVNSSSLSSGSYVCFERGGIWRNAALVTKAGVTYTAYGTGAKPILCGSPENGAVSSKWKRASGVVDVWYYVGSDAWKDVGTLVFNDGEAYAAKIVRKWVDGQVYDFTNNRSFSNGYKDLTDDLSFFHDVGGTGLLYLCSEENPGLRFRSIEFNVAGNLVSVNGTNDVTVTNIAFRHGGSHGVGANGTYLKNLTVKDCTFEWIGGSVHRVNDNHETRFGNGVEIYGGCENYTVEHCWFDQIYDAAVTHQYSGVGNTVYNAKNVKYLNNVIEHCVYSIEYFYSGCEEDNPSVMDGFLIEGNYCWYASYGLCETRPSQDRSWGAHIKGRSSRTGNRAKNYVIRNNYFIGCKDRLVQITSNLYNPDGSDSMPTFSGNVFVLEYGKKFGQVEQRSDPGNQIDAKFDLDVIAYLGGKTDGTDQFWFAPANQ